MQNVATLELLKQVFISAIAEDKLDTLLAFLLTPEEAHTIPQRLILTKYLLDSKESQRMISEKTGISIAKITRGSNEIKRLDPTFKRWLQHQLLTTIYST